LKDGTTDLTAQPNLDVSSGQTTWPLRFWLITALTGLFAGLIGGALMKLLAALEHLAWTYDSGTYLEAVAHASPSRHILMLLIAGLLVGVGGVIISKTFGPAGDAEAAVWFRSGHLPLLSTLAKSVNSIATVALGSSLGRESPIKQAGGAVASWMAQRTRLSRAEHRVLVACGIGAGMAAAYNVPVGAALFTVEVLLGSIALRLALPALLCSGVATAASWLFLPTGPIYRVPEYPLSVQLTLWSLLAGPLLGLATIPLVRLIGWADAQKPRAGAAIYIAPVLLLTILGVLSIAFPQLLGNGKDDVQLAFEDKFAISLLLILPALKLLATAGCLSAGASGGLFTPTMTIGALLGGLLGHAWNSICPGASMGSCSVIGSCAFLAASSQGPISSLVLVLELTRHVDGTMVPMLIAVAGAMLVARRIEARSIYSIRLHLRKPKPGVPNPAQFPAFAGMISSDFATISSAEAYATVVQHLWLRRLNPPVYVLDDHGKLLGKIALESLDIGSLGAIPIEAAKAADLVTPIPTLHSQMSETEIANRLAAAAEPELPVIDSETGRMIGVVPHKRPT
jgi:chloride channel protein, CIC family